jgi:hypothetical protein
MYVQPLIIAWDIKSTQYLDRKIHLLNGKKKINTKQNLEQKNENVEWNFKFSISSV